MRQERLELYVPFSLHGNTERLTLFQATITWPMVEMFSRLCPLCKMRQKGQASRPAGADDDSPMTPRSASVKR